MAETTVRTVKVKVNGQCLSTSEVLTVNGTVNMIVCEIETDNWWTAFPAIIAIFKNDNDGREYIADVINGRCTVPHEVLRKAGNILMAIKGENETQIERSETKVIAVQKRTLQDGANSIDPSPNQYAEYIERAGEAIQEYFDEHKSEFKGDPGEPGEPGPPGDPGEPGPPGPEYDDTEIRSEIASIQQELNDKMEFYKVVLEGSPVKFWHEGVVQNYADLEAKYRDDKYFLYAEYESVTFIPSLPPDEDPVHPENVIEFSATWLYEGVQHITSIKINELEQIKIEEFECASSDDLNDVKKDLNDKVDDVKVNGTSVVTDGVADIPIKEPQFELIEEVTLTENVTVERESEPNGTPYNFKSALVKIEVPSGATFPNNYISFYKDQYNRVGRVYIFSKTTATNEECKALCYDVGGLKLALGFPLANKSSIVTQVNSWSDYNLSLAGNIIRIKIEVALPIGSKVTIYGIRA